MSASTERLQQLSRQINGIISQVKDFLPYYVCNKFDAVKFYESSSKLQKIYQS